MRVPFVLFGATIALAVACGARTGLPVPKPPDVDAGPDVVDAPPDVFDAPDVSDAPPDVPIEISCADAGTQYIYVITQENDLFSFYPPNNAFTPLGPIDCPSSSTPFSMAVTRSGVAFSVFSDGNLFQFDTGNPSQTCGATPYQPTPFGSTTNFGMAFSADLGDTGETLYVASGDPTTGPTIPEYLGDIDINAFQLDPVGQMPSVIGSAELTGTGDGRLFGFGVDQGDAGVTTFNLVEFDKSDASFKSSIPINFPTGSAPIRAWAFSYYGGNFYFFTALTTDAFSRVSLYVPQPGDTAANPQEILTLDELIVGAGVSTCAPMQ